MSDNPEKKQAAPAPEERRPAAEERRAVVETRPSQPRQAVAPAGHDDFDAVIEAWWGDHFPGSAVARDTSSWNHAMAAVDDLKRRLSGRR